MDIADIISDIKTRLQGQHHLILNLAEGKDANLTLIRAELDALWECVEALGQLAMGILPERMVVHDYFTESEARKLNQGEG